MWSCSIGTIDIIAQTRARVTRSTHVWRSFFKATRRSGACDHDMRLDLPAGIDAVRLRDCFSDRRRWPEGCDCSAPETDNHTGLARRALQDLRPGDFPMRAILAAAIGQPCPYCGHRRAVSNSRPYPPALERRHPRRQPRNCLPAVQPGQRFTVAAKFSVPITARWGSPICACRRAR